jgi:hypothetical protein
LAEVDAREDPSHGKLVIKYIIFTSLFDRNTIIVEDNRSFEESSYEKSNSNENLDTQTQRYLNYRSFYSLGNFVFDGDGDDDDDTSGTIGVNEPCPDNKASLARCCAARLDILAGGLENLAVGSCIFIYNSVEGIDVVAGFNVSPPFWKM